MGREVRRVPPDWEHPRDERGIPIPLRDGYDRAVARWEADCAAWCAGKRPRYASDKARAMPNTALAFALYDGDRPTPGTYMPDWPAEERTHWQMYEDTTEGTPISPVMAGPEMLARWLADNNASWFGYEPAGFEVWLRICTREN